MHLFHHLAKLAQFKKPLFITLGVFDGVHLGHQSILRETVQRARSHNGEAVIVTFSPHPAKILRPESAPLLLTTEQQDYELFSSLDVDICIVLNFNKQLSCCPPRDFLERLLKSAPLLHTIVTGPSWHFGYQRKGNFQFLKLWASDHQLCAMQTKPIYVGEQMVSSTMIRNKITAGDIGTANTLLGRPYQIIGRVIRGEGLGGNLGFPTANLLVENELIPGRGVYAAQALVEEKTFPAAVNIGCKPTVSKGKDIVIEAHLLQFNDTLYGRHIRLNFMAHIREERKFKNLDDLKIQIESDSKEAFRLVPY